ncbi:MAG: hypothetical protein H6838_02400 [Planctomycetes bacterium]|nr:hypothetical protein [Planctomycetota bacterium]
MCVLSILAVGLATAPFALLHAGRLVVLTPGPPLRVWAALLGAALLALLLTRRGVGERWRNLLLSLALGGLWVSCRAMPLGDAYLWRRHAGDGVVTWSEMGSSALYALVARLLGPGAIEWLSPLAGIVATWCWLQVLASLRRAGEPATRITVLGDLLVWMGSGVMVTFCFGYVEHTQWGVAPLLLACGSWSRYPHAALPGRAFAIGASWLGLAAMMHAQYVGLLVAIPLLALANVPRRGLRAALLDLVSGVIAVLAVAAGVFGLVWLSGLRIVSGHVHGGADGQLLMPFGALLGAEHLTLVGLVLLFAVPALAAACLVVLFSLRTALAGVRGGGIELLAAGYVAFVVLMQFDLGWPQDVDLMVTMSAPLSLLVARLLHHGLDRAHRPIRSALLLGLFALLFSTWSIAGPLLRPIDAPVAQQNQPGATLLLTGRDGDQVTLEVRGPAGAPFVVFEGPPSPGYSGFAYSGRIDLRLADKLLDTPKVAAGTLDAQGIATVRYAPRRDAGGALLAVQAMVSQPVASQPRASQTSPGPVSVRFSAAVTFDR